MAAVYAASILGLVVVGRPDVAWADESTGRPRTSREAATVEPGLEEADAYCEHVREASHSEALRLRSPWLAFRGSTLQSSELSFSFEQDVIYRGRAGLGVSVTDWVRAELVEQLGDAECAFRRAQAKIGDAADWDSEVLLLEGFRAKAEALKAAHDEALRVVDESGTALDRNERTIAQHIRTLGAFQTLSTELAAASAKVTELSRYEPLRPDLNPKGISDLHRTANELGTAQGRLRRSEAFLVTLEGGYDEILDVEQNVPVYAQVNAVFRPLWLFQGGPERRSAAALARASVAQAEQRAHPSDPSVRILLDQRPIMRTESVRLRKWASTLKAERARLLDAQSRDGAILAEQLWFQGELASAEATRLETSLRVLDRVAAR